MKTREQLIQELRDLSDKMNSLGNEICFFAGFDRELARHGLEMIGASKITASWADEMEKEK